MRVLRTLVAIGGVLVVSPAAQATEREPDPRVVIDGVRQTDLKQIPYSIDGVALDVRRAAANGIGAPQIGLEARYGKKERQRWREAQLKYPKWTEPFAPCVEKFELAIEEIRRIAPLTRRPAWDSSVDEINAALRQARNLVGVGDSCMEDGRYAFNSMASRAKAANDRRVLEGRIAHDEDQNRPDGGYQRDPTIPEWSPPADGRPRWPGGIDPTQPPVRVPGGYDPCANPRPPPLCSQPAASLPPQRGGVAGGGADPGGGGSGGGAAPTPAPIAGGAASTGPTACWPKTAQRTDAVDALRRLGEFFANRRSNLSISDEFTFHLAAGVRSGFEQLSKKMIDQLTAPHLLPGQFGPTYDPQLVTPVVRDMLNYLNDRKAKPDLAKVLLQRAEAAVRRTRDAMMSDPGFYIGQQLPEAFVGECAALPPTPAATRLVTQASEDVVDLSRAARKIGDIDDAFREFVGTGSWTKGSLRATRNALGLPAPRYNSRYGEGNCQHCVTAQIHEWITGEHTTAPDTSPMLNPAIVDDLRRRYGELPEAPPGLAPELRPQWHAGVPFRLPGPASLRTTFEDGGIGSVGYVYYRRAVAIERDAAGQPTRYGLEGHVLTILHGPNGVRLDDPQAGMKDVWEMAVRDMELYGLKYYPVRLGGTPR